MEPVLSFKALTSSEMQETFTYNLQIRVDFYFTIFEHSRKHEFASDLYINKWTTDVDAKCK